MPEVVFWSAAFLIFYSYLGYPATLFVLSRVRCHQVRRRAIHPSVSFIITARNEAARIAEKLENALAQDYPASQLEIIVASDCSSDATDAIVRRDFPRVRLVRSPRREGKEAAQALAIAAARGDVFVFSDVATALAPDCVSRLVENFADPSVGCVSSTDRFVDAAGEISGEGAYVKYEMWLRTLETRVNSLVGLSGSLFATRRELCSEWPSDLQSDFSTLLRAVQMGYRGVLDPESAGYYRNITDSRGEFSRKVRTVVRGLTVLGAHTHMFNPARYGLFAWQLASHKLSRWVVPFAMIAALGANLLLLGSPFYVLLLIAQVAFYATACAGLKSGASFLRVPAFLLQANAAVLTAWLRYLRGERMVVWNPSDRTPALPQVNVP